MRINLKILRIKHGLSQEEISEKIGCKRAAYSAIESGLRSGKQTFWKRLQQTFDVPDSEMWSIMKNE